MCECRDGMLLKLKDGSGFDVSGSCFSPLFPSRVIVMYMPNNILPLEKVEI